MDNPSDWGQVSSIIDEVMKTGTTTSYKDISMTTKIIKGRTVIVRHTLGGQIGTAFVR